MGRLCLKPIAPRYESSNEMLKTEFVTCKLRTISVSSPVNAYNLSEVREAVLLWA
jgi:hypothetical protein